MDWINLLPDIKDLYIHSIVILTMVLCTVMNIITYWRELREYVQWNVGLID